jgi:outer membrane protein TolC
VTVLAAKRASLDARSALIDARRQRLETRIDLYLALGGGFVETKAS